MTLRSIAVLSLLSFSAAAWADASFSRTLQTSDQPDLYVSTGAGNIHITRGDDREVRITGRVHAGWAAFGDVSARVQQIVDHPPITQSGNAIHVGESTDRSLFNNISIDYDISVPANVALNLHSGSGDLDVNQAGRFVAASSGSGNLRLHGIHGPADVGTGSGDIVVEETSPGDVRAKAGSGNIQIHGMNGALNARAGSGDVEMDGRLAGGSNIAAGSGNVKLHVTQDSHFTLEASTGSGDIRVQLPGANSSTDSSRHHVTESINGGGPPVEIRTGSGDIVITGRS